MTQHQYKYKAVATKYNKTLYRSRLEAQWAAFFDLINWGYAYEPIDLQKWSPDFVITTTAGSKFLVEVKPSRLADINLRMKVGIATNFSDGILIVSESPFTDQMIPNVIGLSSVMGKIRNFKNEEDFEFCTSVIYNAFGKGNDVINLCEVIDISLSDLTKTREFCKELWNEAGSIVQFLKPI